MRGQRSLIALALAIAPAWALAQSGSTASSALGSLEKVAEARAAKKISQQKVSLPLPIFCD